MLSHIQPSVSTQLEMNRFRSYFDCIPGHPFPLKWIWSGELRQSQRSSWAYFETAKAQFGIPRNSAGKGMTGARDRSTSKGNAESVRTRSLGSNVHSPGHGAFLRHFQWKSTLHSISFNFVSISGRNLRVHSFIWLTCGRLRQVVVLTWDVSWGTDHSLTHASTNSLDTCFCNQVHGSVTSISAHSRRNVFPSKNKNYASFWVSRENFS
jgi:hypothetical protein